MGATGQLFIECFYSIFVFVDNIIQTSVGQILGYSNKFQYTYTNILISLNIRWFFPRRIYSDIHSGFIYSDKCIRIFICPISMIANTFEFSLFPKSG